MIVYPECPECETAARHQPISVESGRSTYHVQHNHDCPVRRYACTVDASGEQSSEALPRGVTFEEQVAC